MKFKKILSVILSLAMVLTTTIGLNSTNVYAADATVNTWNELRLAVEAAPTNGTLYTIDVTSNITADMNCMVGAKNIVIQSTNGSTITRASLLNGASIFNLSGSNLTFEHITVQGDGTTTYTSPVIWNLNGKFTMGTEATIKDMTIDYNGPSVVRGWGGSDVVNIHDGALITNVINVNTGDYSSIIDAEDTLNIDGGIITNNQADHGILYEGQFFNLSGSPNISGNTKADGTTPSNVFLSSNRVITVNSSFTPVTPIGITTGTVPAEGSPVNVTMANSADLSSFFVSDNSNYIIQNSESDSSQIVQLALKSTTIDVSDSSGTNLPTGVTYTGNLFTIDSGANNSTITVTGITTENSIAVATDVSNLTLILNNVSITSPSSGKSPIDLLGNANVTIELANDTTNTLNASSADHMAGLRVPSTATVTINGTTGEFNATGGACGAGIGGGDEIGGVGGNIIIGGGKITALGGPYGAGIGGSGTTGGAGGNTTISGGIVNATGGECSAGIGSSINEDGGNIDISGGTIIASCSSNGGAGIGGGNGGTGGNITISHGTVTATGKGYGAGIGGGSYSGGGNITISGGTVNAIGGVYGGAGIGGGGDGWGGNITIDSSAVIMAVSVGNSRPAIDAISGSSGSVTNAKLNNAISTTDDSFLSCNGNVLKLPADYLSFAFCSPSTSEVNVYSDLGCSALLGNIVTNPAGESSIPVIDLSTSPTTVTPVKFGELYNATVTVNKDGSAWSVGTPNIQLSTLNTALQNAVTGSSIGNVYTFSGLTSGKTYYVFDTTNGQYTGQSITSSSTSAIVNYFTVTLASGTGIDATMGEGTYLSGSSVSIDATVSSGNTWSKWTDTTSGNDVSTTKNYNIPSITSALSYTANVADSGTAPVINTTSLTNGTVGNAYSQTIDVTGTAPINWTIVAGSLTPGLHLDESTGAITGTPIAVGTSNFTVQASNSKGSDTKALSITVSVASTTIDVSDSSGTNLPIGVTYAGNLFTIDTSGNNSKINVTGTTTANSIAVATGVSNLTLVLNNVSITSPAGGKSPIDLQGTANVTIQLTSDTTNTLNARNAVNMAGLHVPSTANVTINGTGSLNATGGADLANTNSCRSGAGIGGGANESGGNIHIIDGKITANGGNDGHNFNAAGIGGGSRGAGGNITIDGGTVVAAAGIDGAGIGGGDRPTAPNGTVINITGGDVTADGNFGRGAAIGGGSGERGSSVTISGGTVYASSSAAGIGTGYGAGNTHTITISGGTVQAYGANGSAGIGGSVNSSAGNISITGGTVTAAGVLTGIGGGLNGSGGTIKIESAATVKTWAKSGMAVDTSATFLGSANVLMANFTTLRQVDSPLGPIITGIYDKSVLPPVEYANINGFYKSIAFTVPVGTYKLKTGGVVQRYAVDASTKDTNFVVSASGVTQFNSVEDDISPLASYTPVTLTQTGDIAHNNVQYGTAATVIAALPTNIAVTLENDTVVNVPVNWEDTDTYDSGTAGTYTFTASWGTLPAGANNANSLAYPTVGVTVVNGGVAPTITTDSLDGATVGTAYSQTLVVMGTAPIDWSITVGSLPAGLSLDASIGEITGTPTAAGTSNFTVQASNSNGSATKSFSISITVSAPTTYTLTITAGSGGTVSSVGGTYAAGEQISITATPNNNYSFSGWTSSNGGSFANATSASTTFTMPANNTTLTAAFSYNGGGSGGSGGSSGTATPVPTPTATPVPIIVDNNNYFIGKVDVENNTATITVNQPEFEKQLADAKESVVVSSTADASTVVAQLVVKNVQDMNDRGVPLSVQTRNVDYKILADSIDTNAILSALGVTDPASVPMNIMIKTDVDSATQELVNSTVQVAKSEIVVPAVQFEITATYNDKTYKVESFRYFVNRCVEITQEQAQQITTAIVINPDRTIRHVPTFVYQREGKWYAQINSLTNSTYALIFNQMNFEDSAGKWYQSVVNEMGSRKIINGVGNNNFAGDKDITRAEFAATLVQALGLPTNGSATFADVPSDSWFSGAVATATQYGIVCGIGNNKFAPNAIITREEAMVMIYNASKLTPYVANTSIDSTQNFTDYGKQSIWATQAVNFNLNNGLIEGYNAQFNPKSNITRAETAAVVLRLLQKSGLVDIRTKL